MIRSDLEGYEYNIIVNNNLALAVTYGAATVTLTTAIPGDANLDHTVNLADLQIIGDNWNGTGKSWFTGDLTGDGNVNLADLQILGDHWGQSGDFAELAAQYIPEPGALVLLLAGTIATLARRRRCCARQFRNTCSAWIT
ncbi:MAG: PEP-CTERM sorting domain-containing protein [Phycisphaeraceae bacterium]|nr:PEP-CTERM sorting domain-containing protein [Phycisphaeraceae bacterium]